MISMGSLRPPWPALYLGEEMAAKQKSDIITIFCRSCFLYPVCKMSDKVKEEISFWDADNLWKHIPLLIKPNKQ